MRQLPAITPAESEVMEVLWRTAPLTAEDISSQLQAVRDWQLPTIKTLLNRLLHKRALSAKQVGRRYLYAPRVTREQWLATESTGLLDRLFDGRLAPFVAHFSRHRKLSAQDIEEIRVILEELINAR